MVYDPTTDFLGLWRATTGGVEKAEMPGLDWWVAAMGRSGLLNVVVSDSPPVVNQSTTAWFDPHNPSWSAEGVLYLWDGTQYVPATPGLFYTYLTLSLGALGLAVWLVTGAPSDSVGINGDIALRLDAPGGIYAPKAAGTWPADPLPGTSYSQISSFLDVLGTTQGDIVYRGASAWVVLAPGTAGQILTSGGAAANPAWASSGSAIQAGLDSIGSTQGDILYRNATVWTVLAPGTSGQILQSGGAGANPSWTTSSSFTLTSAAVDAAFGATAGGVLVRGSAWTNSGAGSAGQVLTSNGAGAATFQTFAVTSAALDATFGGTQGSVLYRGASAWTALAPGVSGQFLKTNGAGANPAWSDVSLATAGYPIGSTLTVQDGNIVTDPSLTGALGVGVVTSFWNGVGSAVGLLITYNRFPTPGAPFAVLTPPGLWQIISYLGDGAQSIGTADPCCCVVRVA